jgi:hypothetical protein
VRPQISSQAGNWQQCQANCKGCLRASRAHATMI